jgi:hypothetical protein
MADFKTLINTNNVRGLSITTPKIADANVTVGKMATDSVNTSQLVALSVTTAKLAATSVTAAKLNVDTAGAGLSLDNATGLAVGAERGLQTSADAVGIADSGVVTAYIADANVTTAKLNDASVTTAKINDAAVTTAKIADANVTSGKIADANVLTAKIADDAVTAAKLNDDVAQQEKGITLDGAGKISLKIRTAGGGQLAFDSLANNYQLFVPANSITATELADGSVDTAAIQANAVTSSKADLGASQTWIFTNAPQSSAVPTAGADLTNKTYVDGLVQGLDIKGSVRAGTTSNITLEGLQTIDGVVLVAGNRVLVKNQTAAAENGIYSVVDGGLWTRTADMDAGSEFPSAFTFVEEGGQADTGWVCTTNNPVTVGTTPITWVQFSSAGVALPGQGLEKVGNTFNVKTAAAQGTQIAGENQVSVKIANLNPGLALEATGIKAVADAQRGLTLGATGMGLNIMTSRAMIFDASNLALNAGNEFAFNAGTGALELANQGVAFGKLSTQLQGYVGMPAGRFATPAIDGSGAVATVSNVFSDNMPATLVYLNGLLQIKGASEDYTTALAAGVLTITFADAVSSADRVVVLYKPANVAV